MNTHTDNSSMASADHSLVPSGPHSAKDILYLLETEALPDLPNRVCKLMEGCVCVIWKPSHSMAENPDEDPEVHLGQLYPYSSNFQDPAAEEHAGMPADIRNDTTGRFYRSGEPASHDNNFLITDGNSLSNAFMQSQKICRVCSARFKMPEGEKGDFVVSVYRRDDDAPFDLAAQMRLQYLAECLNLAYQRLIASQLRGAIEKVNVILRPHCENLEAAKMPLADLCKTLSRLFRTLEVSIFLSDASLSSDKCRLFATSYNGENIKHEYSRNPTDGLTGYILSRKVTLSFHNLHNFDDLGRRRLIEKRYPGINWTDGVGNRRFGQDPTLQRLPLQFTGVPIVGEAGNALGVLRTSLGINPFYFLHGQIKTLEIIASEIGRWWESILHGIVQTRRFEIWQALNKTITVQHDSLRGSDIGSEDISGLITQTVDSLSKQPGFDLVTFRAGKDPEGLSLMALSLSERHCKELTVRRPNSLPEAFPKGARLPLRANLVVPERNRGFLVIETARSRADIASGASTEEREVFAELTWVLSCAVFIRTKLYGVLDIGFANERDYLADKDRIHEFTKLIGRQLALFARIAESVQEVERTQKNEVRTYSVITHQLKTPLENARNRLRNMTKEPLEWNEGKAKLLAQVSGMVSKARSVTNTINFIGDLVSGKTIRANCRSEAPEDVWRLCLEVAQNNLILLDPAVRANFQLHGKREWGPSKFYWERDFAEQCLDAVINNAFKYSEIGTPIAIKKFEKHPFCIIRVSSVGEFSISPSETESCKQQEYRGEMAQAREGRGLGLWITDCLMKAQGGELHVHPTSSRGETDIDLAFLRDNKSKS